MTRLLAIMLASCAASSPDAPCSEPDPYEDALAAVRSLGARVDEHVVIRPLDGMPGGDEVNGVRVVRLPRAYLATVVAGYGYAAAVGVAAHELAHLPGGSHPFAPPSGEVEAYADSVAGCALARLGLDADGYESLVGAISRTRAKAARRGWEACARRFAP